MKLNSRLFLPLAFISIIALVGCGVDEDDSASKSCESTSECGDGTVCVAKGSGAGTCTLTCSGSLDECSATASCGGVGTLSVSVCQEDPEKGETPAAQEQPRIPCKTDADCGGLHTGAICAEWQGERDCTIGCAVEEDCSIPEIGGMSVDFMTCIPDERPDQSRTACLPDQECFANPMLCVDMGEDIPDRDFGDLGEGFGDGFGDGGGDGAGDGFGFGGGGDPSDM